MNAWRLSAAAVLLAGAYVFYRDASIQAQDAGEGGATFEPLDLVAETVSAVTGIELMKSSRYAAALANPKNAGVIAALTSAAARHGVPPDLLVRQAWQESRFNPAAVSPVGARGIMQFMPATAREWGVDTASVESSAEGGAAYMAWLYGRLGSWPLALAAYNWGIGNVLRKGLAAAPTETQQYLAEIGADTGIA